MNIKLLAVGKTVKGFCSEGTDEYISRLKHYIGFSMEIIPDVKNASSLSPAQLKDLEADNILKHISPTDTVIMLDEHGSQMRSMEFASMLQKQMNMGTKTLVFLIGGAFGFSQKIYDRFPKRMSISSMTFSHQMIRLLFTEQLYRAFTIIKGEPYHNE